MKRMTNGLAGRLITIEGVTGAGKSYFTRHLAKRLRGVHHMPVTILGGFGDQEVKEDQLPHITLFVRQLMRVGGRFLGLPWLCETTLLLAEQAFYVETYLLPALRSGNVVLYVSYNDALVAYQLMRGASTGRTQDSLLRVLKQLIDLQFDPFHYPKQNLTVYVSAPDGTCFQRLLERDHRPVSAKDKKVIRLIKANYAKLYESRKYVVLIDNHGETDLSSEVEETALRIARMPPRAYA
ncbi:hypothetical protein FJY68_08120 [candidate division WOR-3 bacterium]|uniref:Thymidylate kinase-like domain-containing protein n=1 Tax=candidate division WOR-3 bacterium TaxID=2052148 RepID=A0A938BRN3_UNCW3|nr:hypothetical protein [candidate division WOR-3 bacterium]